MSESVSFALRNDIALITIENPPVNALSQAVRSGLKAAITQGEQDSRVKAMVLICAGRSFSAGADIHEFGKPPQEPLLVEVIEEIEQASKPIVAAIHGTALGGGLEVALGCHFRIASMDAKMGLPEVKLGLLPGAGGTQRLPRLIGVPAALELIVDGGMVSAERALELGLIDERVVSGKLEAAALDFARGVIDSSMPVRRLSTLDCSFSDSDVFEAYTESVTRKRRGYIAPLRCIAAVQAAAELPFAKGMERERAMFLELAASFQSKAQRHAFFAERAAARVPDATLKKETEVLSVDSVGVVGAGTMGTGIAMCFANVGIPVLLLETNADNLERGVATIRKNYARTMDRGGLTQAEMDRRIALIRPSAVYEDLAQVDLVIEAVFEELGVKQMVFRMLDQVCKPGAILASNTSYLNIDAIADVTARPEYVLGMHFFSPANVMPLLENVRGAKTLPQVCAAAMKVGKVIGKTPVMVRVCDGFVGNRMLAKRTRESYFMLEEGATPQQIDRVLYDFGFPMGPFAMSDLAGVDVGWLNRQSRLANLTSRERACDILDQVHALGRFGQKTGAGFYRYEEDRSRHVDPKIEELIVNHSKKRGIERRQIPDSEIIERCLYPMINEAAKLLEEGIVDRPGDIDVVWLKGYGFPAFLGGPLFYADHIGLPVIHQAMLKYQAVHGEQYWKPAALLEDLVRSGKQFYS
ncbi:fatty oxidation complex, alpha subunit [Pusillimonas sp. T7-7]|uniref:3-hydroxyacyl-CoA dehydrogenase NAD-binding domain-containing protein n=1 Tax=Pusillimonas sp. (strain T7-7) TaxID=1007105 RepID=UPI0002084E3E|nr:3-hydroxyacyl-CoA dehydrogenase NAD-binding domain-containing protein [Pusillimonas sp. T7-7]AEC21768.1 fatty oxidation complex, alpha subunit [Pusillimonas sp. T7-7]